MHDFADMIVPVFRILLRFESTTLRRRPLGGGPFLQTPDRLRVRGFLRISVMFGLFEQVPGDNGMSVSCQKRPSTALFDNVISAGEDGLWECESD